MGFEPFHLAFGLFRFLHCFWIRGALLGGNFLKVEVHGNFLARGNPHYSFVGFVGSRQLDENGISPRLQMGNNVVPILVRLYIRLDALIADSLDAHIRPRLAVDIQDLPLDGAVSLRRRAGCKRTGKHAHQDCGEPPRLINSLHAPFSFFTGRPARVPGPRAPHYLSSAPDSKPACGRQAQLKAETVRR